MFLVNRLRRAPDALALAGVVALALPAVAQQAAAPAPSAMDGPMRLIEAAARSYQNVQTYTCMFIKQEQIRGQMQPVNVMAMKVRAQPFGVYLQWLGPAHLKGQEACYVDRANGGQMRVHATGVRSIAGFVSVDVNDPRVMQNSRHTITEAGIGNLITRYGERWRQERTVNKTTVNIAEYDYDGRKCWRVEMTHPDPNAMHYYCYRSVVYFDKQTSLPVRVENYDWPRQGGPPGGALLESYSYAKLQFNVRLTDADFNK